MWYLSLLITFATIGLLVNNRLYLQYINIKDNCKIFHILEHDSMTYWGVEVKLEVFLIKALDKREWSALRPGVHWVKSWLSPRTGLGLVGLYSPCSCHRTDDAVLVFGAV